MVFLLPRRHFCLVSMLMKINLILRGYGTISCKKKEGLIVQVALQMKRILLSLQRQRKEKQRRFPIKRIKARNQGEDERHLTCQRSNASTVRSLATMLKIVLIKEESTKENIMHLLLIWKMNLKERKQGNQPVVRLKGRNTVSSHLSLVPSPIVLRLGWWIVALPDI